MPPSPTPSVFLVDCDRYKKFLLFPVSVPRRSSPKEVPRDIQTHFKSRPLRLLGVPIIHGGRRYCIGSPSDNSAAPPTTERNNANNSSSYYYPSYYWWRPRTLIHCSSNSSFVFLLPPPSPFLGVETLFRHFLGPPLTQNGRERTANET